MAVGRWVDLYIVAASRSAWVDFIHTLLVKFFPTLDKHVMGWSNEYGSRAGVVITRCRDKDFNQLYDHFHG